MTHGVALQSVDFFKPNGERVDGLVSVREQHSSLRPDERSVISEAAAFEEVDFVFFRRFADGRSSQVAAFVVDNSDERLNEQQLARLHSDLWLHGEAPLVYVAWPTRIDILSCSRGPDFWVNEEHTFNPADQIHIASEIDSELKKRRRFSALRLADGTFWDDPQNSSLANHERTAHESLIQAIVEVDAELDGQNKPVLRRLLLLTVLLKYLEDRRVFPNGWFGRFRRGSRSFFEVLKGGEPEQVIRLLQALERRFNGDVFSLPTGTQQRLSRRSLRQFAQLVEARTITRQRYLWEQYSFGHLPVEVVSHLYQRFVQGHGAVYTPPFLAALLLDHVMPYDKLTGKERILDPACGSGVFLVGAFRRLVTHWRSKHRWRQPDVETLKAILTRSIFGVELDSGAVDLAAFSLSLAVCDALKPDVIWSELRFDPLRGRNLHERDFFDFVLDRRDETQADTLGKFDIVVGNPPFESTLTDAGKKLNDKATSERGRLPDKQAAYLFLEQSLDLLKPEGRLCLIQPHGFLYNQKTFSFRQRILRKSRVETLLDFISIRNLYDGADPKTVAVLAVNEEPADDHVIIHLTFRRTFSAYQRIGFEIDHYDRHRVSQQVADSDSLVWRINVLGGGRLVEFATRLRETSTISDFVKGNDWIIGEGFIVGNRAHNAPFLTGKRFLPNKALTDDGIDKSELRVVEETHFEGPRNESLFQSPLMVIKENERLPSAFWDMGDLAYKNEIVGIHAAPSQSRELKRFFRVFQQRLRQYQFCCTANGSRTFSTKATSVYKIDIESLPYPEDERDLDFTYWERAIQDDVIDYIAPFVRLGQNSELLRKAADASVVESYADMFCRLLGSIYDNLQAASPVFLSGLICQPFYFGDAPNIDWLGEDCQQKLLTLVYDQSLESLRTVRVVRLYHENMVLIVKPDRLRYWIRSTAIRDADDTVVDLHQQGY